MINSHIPYIAKFKVTLPDASPKECKVTLLVPTDYRKAPNATQRLQHLFKSNISRILKTHNPEVFEQEFLPVIKIVKTKDDYIPDASLKQDQFSSVEDIELITITQFSPGETSELDASAAKLIPVLANLWPIYTKGVNKSLEQQEFEKGSQLPSAFIDLISFFAQTLDSYSSKVDDAVENKQWKEFVVQLKRMAELGREKDVKAIARAVIQETVNGPVTVPLGYYRGGNYVPLLLIFQREASGLHVSTIALDPGLGKKARPFHRYRFGKDEAIVSQQVSTILELLSRYKQQPGQVRYKEGVKGLDQLERKQILMAMRGGGEKTLVEAQERLDNFKEYLEAVRAKNKEKAAEVTFAGVLKKVRVIFVEENTRLSEEEKLLEPEMILFAQNPDEEVDKNVLKKLLKIEKDLTRNLDKLKRQHGEPDADFEVDKRDVTSLIHAIITDQAGVEPLALSADLSRSFKTHKDKLAILYTWLYERNSQITREHQLRIETTLFMEFAKVILNSKLSPDNEFKALKFLEQNYRELEKSFQKELGSTAALENISDTVFNGLLSKIRNKLADFQFQHPLTQIVNFTPNEYVQWNFDYQEDIDTTAKSGASKSLPPFGVVNRATYDDLRSAFRTKNFPAAKVSIEKLLADCKQLYHAQEFRELELATTSILTMYPDPTAEVWNHFSGSQLAELSGYLTELTELLWEANLKQGNSYVWPDTVFALMKARANIYHFMQLRITDIKKNMIDKFKRLDPVAKAAFDRNLAGSRFDQKVEFVEFLEGKPALALYEANLAMHASIVNKELGLSAEEAGLLLLNEFTIDAEQPIYLLSQHPYFRYSRDKDRNDEIERIVEFYGNIKRKSTLKKPIFLDSLRYTRDPNRGDFEFLSFLLEIADNCGLKKNSQATIDDVWLNTWKKSTQIFPHQLIDWRSQLLYSQVILHPRSTLYKGFSSTTAFDKAARSQYILNELNKVQGEDAKDYDTLLRLMTESQAAQINQQLSSMGPLKLKSGMDSEKDYPSINITDAQGTHFIFYQPDAIDVFDFRDPYSNQAIAGNTPPALLLSQAGKVDWKSSKNKNREQVNETNQAFTEATITQEEQTEGSTNLSAEINTRLRTLVVNTSNNPKPLEPSPNTFYNVIDFILDYPYLLEIESVQRVLDQALYQTSVIKKGIENRDYFIHNAMKGKFNQLIKNALDHDQLVIATYLLQIGASVNNYASEQLLPDFKSPFSYANKKLLAFDLLLKAAGDAKTNPTIKKYIYTYLLNEFFKNTKDKPLTQAEVLIVLRGHAVIKNSGAVTGDLMLQKTLLDWVDQNVLKVMKSPLTKENQNLLTALYTGTDLKPGETVVWQEDPKEPLVYSSYTGAVIDLRRGTIKGSAVEEIGFPTQLPSQIAEHPDYVKLFGKQAQEVLATTPPARRLNYSSFEFNRNGKHFKLLYHPSKKKLYIYQVIGSQEYRYEKIKLRTEQSNKNAEKLFERYGLWRNESQKEIAYLICQPVSEWKDKDLIRITFTNGIYVCRTNDGFSLYNDTQRKLSDAFPFVDPSDLMITYNDKKTVKMTILSKNITIQKNAKSEWKGRDELKDYTLVTEKAKLSKLNKTFGPYYTEYVLPFEKKNDVTNVTTHYCLLFPVKFQKPMSEGEMAEFHSEKVIETRAAAERDIACLPVSFETGRGDGEDGRIKTSSAGFFYLAYTAYFHGEYENAIRYLEKAIENPFNVKERKAYELIEGYIRDHKDNSIRGLAFRLKAELIMRSIRRDKLDVKEFRPQSWKTYLDKIRHDVELFKAYQKALSQQKGHRKEMVLGTLLQLTDDDVRAYEKLINESFDFLIEIPPPVAPKLTPASEFFLKPISRESSQKFASQVARYMRSDAVVDLRNIPTQFSKQEFLTKFWGYVHQIVQSQRREIIRDLEQKVIAYKADRVELEKNPEANQAKIRVNAQFHDDFERRLQNERRSLEGEVREINASNLVLVLKSINVSVLPAEDAALVDMGRQMLVTLTMLHQYDKEYAKTLQAVKNKYIESSNQQELLKEDLEKLNSQMKELEEINDQLKNLVHSMKPPFISAEVWENTYRVIQASNPDSSTISFAAMALGFLTRTILEMAKGITYKKETETIQNVQDSLEFVSEVNKLFVRYQKIMGYPAAEKKEDPFTTTLKIIEAQADISNKESVFSSEEKVYWSTFASQLRTSIENAHQPKTKEITAKELEKLEATKSQAIRSKRPIKDILQVFVEQKTATPAIRHEYETIREISNLKRKLAEVSPASEIRPEANRLTLLLKTELRERERDYAQQLEQSIGSHYVKPSAKRMEADLKNWHQAKNDERDAFKENCKKILAYKDTEQFSFDQSNSVEPEKTLSIPMPGRGFLGTNTTFVIQSPTYLWYTWVLAKIVAYHLEKGLAIPPSLEKALKDDPRIFFDSLDNIDKQITQDQLVNTLEANAAAIKLHYGESEDPMEAFENARIRKGVDDKVAAKKKDIREQLLNKDLIEQDTGVLRVDSMDDLDKFITARQAHLNKLTTDKRSEILHGLKHNQDFLQRSGRLNQRLRSLLVGHAPSKGPDWEAEILDLALDLYKNNELRSSAGLQAARAESLDHLEQAITEYLVFSTESQQLKKAKLTLADMRKLVEKDTLPEKNKMDWEDQSQVLIRILQGAGRTRYVSNDQIDDPIYSRKHLVAEFRSEMIARDFQPKIVKKMVENPNSLILLRPGAGKSKWITPEVAQLICKEKNKFGVILVTDQMLDINRSDTDKTTLEMFKQAGHIFDFHRNSPKDPAFLADEYKRLLQVQLDKGYVITTIGRMASLDDEIVILHKELADLYDDFVGEARKKTWDLSNQEHKSAIQERLLNMMYVQKQLHWLKKTRELFHADASAQTKEVAFIADEVDAIFSPNNDYNFSIEEKNKPSVRPPHPVLSSVNFQIMKSITQNAKLRSLAHLLSINKQSTLSGVDDKGVSLLYPYLQAIAGAIYDDPEAFGLESDEWTKLKSSTMKYQEFVDFVTGKQNIPPDGILRVIKDVPKDKLEEFLQKHPLKYVLALRHFLRSTLPQAMALEANTDYGLGPDGCTVVPKNERRDLPGVRFGNEYDLVVFQYLYQASKSFSFEYFKDQWRKKEYEILGGNTTQEWADWFNKVMAKDVDGKKVQDLPPEKRLEEFYKAFKDPTDPDSTHLRFALLAEDALPNHLRVFNAQVKCNSQDPLHGVNITGASGTVNEYALPDSFDRDSSVYSREVMADTLSKLATMGAEGLNTPIVEIINPLEEILNLSTNLETNFIIDQGAVLEEFSTSETIDRIRQHMKATNKQRQILFVDNVKVGEAWIRKQMMWDPTEPEPKPFDRSKLHSQGLFYFAPADIRGTDWPMPPGKGVLITGANTTDEQLIQAIWRARRLGQGQKIEMRLHSAIAKGLKLALNKEKVTMGDVLKDIQRRTLKQSAGIKYTSRVKKIQSIVPHEIRQNFFRTHIQNEIGYWNIGQGIPESEWRILSDIAVDCHAFRSISDYFIEERPVKFAGELEPAEDIPVMDALKRQSRSQTVRHSNLKDNLRHVEHKVAADFKDLAENAMPALGLISKLLCHPITRLRLEKIKTNIEPLDDSIRDYYTHLENHSDLHLQNLNPRISSSVSDGNEGSKEMVQEQEQQQQQQQQQVVALTANTKRALARDPKDIQQWIHWPEGSKINLAKFKPVPELNDDIMMTENFARIQKAVKVNKGDLLGRLVVFEKEDGKKAFILIDNLDLELGFRVAIAEIKKQKGKEEISVYSLKKSPDVEENPLTFIEGVNKSQPGDDLNYALVQVKLLVGHVLFKTKSEQEALRHWVEHHPNKDELKKFLCRVHQVDVVSQIPNWEKSLLKSLLV